MGRMQSPDPVAGSTWNPQSLNAYSYVWNNPLKLTDPTGMVVRWEDSKASSKKGETSCKTNLQRSYENRIQSLLNSKNAKDVAKGQKLQATYQKLQDAKEVFHVVREGGSGTGELTYRGSPGNLYVEMKGDGSGYGYMPDVQKLGHEFEQRDKTSSCFSAPQRASAGAASAKLTDEASNFSRTDGLNRYAHLNQTQ